MSTKRRPPRTLAEEMNDGRNESFYPTCDDFHSSFDAPEDRRGGFVGIRVFPRYRIENGERVESGAYCVSAYGTRTSSMHLEDVTLDEAREVVRRLPSIITIDHLLSIGFRWT